MLGPSPLTFDSGPNAPKVEQLRRMAPGFNLTERVVTQSEAIHHSGGKVLDHDVALACELAGQFLALIRGEIQCHAELAEVNSVPYGRPVDAR